MEQQPDITAILTEELNDLKQRIADNITNSGRNATGRTIQSLQVSVTPLGADSAQGVLMGRKYFGALETGSQPWKGWERRTRVPKVFADQIGEWINAKGLALDKWAVAYTLIHEGSRLYRAGGLNDVYSLEIPKTLEAIAQRYTNKLAIYTINHIDLNEE